MLLILLGDLSGLVRPFVRDASIAERLVVRDCVALLGGSHDLRIGDLPAHRQESFAPQRLVEPPEQIIDCARLLQTLPDRPDCVGFGDIVGQTEPEKADEGQETLKIGIQSPDLWRQQGWSA